MDGYPFPSTTAAAATPCTYSTTANTSNHSTNLDLRTSLNSLASNAWDQHVIDLQQSHRWLEGFFTNLQQASQARMNGQRPAMSELMKTPGRKRLAAQINQLPLASSNNGEGTTTKKDPLATLLFPAPAGASAKKNVKGKENGHGNNNSENAPRSPGSRALLSPTLGGAGALGKSKSPFGSPVRSPLRMASPRPVAQQQHQAKVGTPVLAPVVQQPEPVVVVDDVELEIDPVPVVEEEQQEEEEEEEVIAAAADLSNVMEEDEEDEIAAVAEASPAEPTRFSNASTVQELDEQANLSIIGEEEEEQDTSNNNNASPLPLAANSSIVLETQFTADASSPLASTSTIDTHLAPAPGSPRSRIVSGASSIAEEADADTAVPLNDAPSLLRTTSTTTTITSNTLSSSLPASATTRTPGGTVSRFGLHAGVGASFSAAKPSVGLGANLGSSPPPPASTAAGMRASTGGARQLNFVGLPKKSLGLGLGLGRSWGGGGVATANESQGSSQGSSGPMGSTAGSTQATSVANSVATTASGGNKRKSLPTTEEGPLKTVRVDSSQQQDATALEEAASKARRDALASRMKNMQARQSAVPGLGVVAHPVGMGGVGARVSGVMGATATTTGGKPLSAGPAPQQQAPVVLPAAVATAAAPLDLPSTTTTSTTFTKPAATVEPLARRPSVMERVKSFEQSHPLASSSSLTTDARPLSPSKIPSSHHHTSTRPTSPTAISIPPKSPYRPLTSPATTARIATASRIAVVSPQRMTLRSSPAPAVLPKSPARALQFTTQQQGQGSTTPRGSPPASASGARSILQALERAAGEPEEVEEREEIRVVQTVEVELEMEEGEEVEREQEGKRLVSLPRELELEEEDGDDEQDEEDEDDDDVVVVEKGRGALASAMDDGASKLPTSASTKSIMPGTFGISDPEEEEEVQVVSKPTAPKPTLHKKGSQSSLASSQSSQSQSSTGMLSSFFGGKSTGAGGVKKQPFGGAGGGAGEPKVVKSIQLAAAAAKKEQLEKERKAAQKEEREQKRLEIVQRKQEEERARRVEEERKVRAEGVERKRKEREEQAGKSAKLVRPKMKVDEEPAKKRKVEDKSRPEIKKPQQLRPTTSTTSNGGYPSSSLNSSQNRHPLATSQSRMGPPTSSAHTTPHATNGGLKTSQSSMIGVKFMAQPGTQPGRVVPGNGAATAKSFGSQNARPAPVVAAPAPAPAPRSEPEVYQELPDIDSEYSDSGDEGHDEKVKALPGWAQSPALAAALYRQQHVNPDEIFGPIQPLSMQEIFRTNSARITKRTSSACWEGTDALTADDLARYNLAMGYTRTGAASSSK